MATALSEPPTDQISRAALMAYLFGLMGVTFVIDNAISMLVHGVNTYAAGMAGAGLFALAGTVAIVRNPDTLRKGSEPAPTYLYILPLISTVAAGILATGWLLRAM